MIGPGLLFATRVPSRALSRPPAAVPTERLASREWFRDAKFGMFIHWGSYSRLAQGE